MYSDPLLMEAKLEQYFDKCEQDGRSPTIQGACLYLGFSHRDALSEYAQWRVDPNTGEGPFTGIVKRAQLRIEDHICQMLLDGEGHKTGPIFYAKCNLGWREGVDVNHTSSAPVTVEVEFVTSDATAPETSE